MAFSDITGGQFAGAGVIGDILGGAINLYAGNKRRNKGDEMYTQGRTDFIGNQEINQQVLDNATNQQNIFANAGNVASEAVNTGVAGSISAMRSASPEMMQAILPQAIQSGALAQQNIGLQTAQNIANSNQGVVDAANRKQENISSLYGQDMSRGQGMIDQGTAMMSQGAGQILGAPGQLFNMGVAGKEAGFNFGDALFAAKGGSVRIPKKGQEIKTSGEFNHDTNEKSLIGEDGGEVGKVTGQEVIQGTKDGAVITNPEQEQSIFDMYQELKDKPFTNENYKKIISVLGGTYEKSQFKMS